MPRGAKSGWDVDRLSPGGALTFGGALGRPGYALGASWRAARFRGLSVVSPLVIVCVLSVLVVQVHALLLSSLHHAMKRLNLATITLSRRMTRLPFSVLTFFGSALMVTRS